MNQMNQVIKFAATLVHLAVMYEIEPAADDCSITSRHAIALGIYRHSPEYYSRYPGECVSWDDNLISLGTIHVQMTEA